ncbi:hypothetical protein BegalDRAFT_1690 [Beggiatoa alba B18LD]|uniref:Uncharacterized protein n=1 Tax=Beggiatoa alba B18LD TaxID=395493 RepID=I3CG25_9GAMM|nr:hypothetical protein [Beggiatoa alba]EIJ42568.1 hypothetical protein BegalDRAFT_1690 [Beggiatoa alba B18LD]
MLQCPVCQFENSETATACQQCAWQFNFYLNLTPEDEATYKAQLLEAQTAWKAQTTTPPASANSQPTATTPKSPTSLPDLTQDVFESEEEFRQRIEQHNPYFAGTATLLREKYDAQKATFPLTVSWEKWLSPADKGLYVKADRTTAKLLYQQNPEQPIQVHLTVKEGQVVITKLSIQCEENSLLIHQDEDDQVWAWAQQYDQAEAYLQYLNSHTLKTHYLEAKKRLKLKALDAKRAEMTTILLYLTFTIVGTTVGTITAIQLIGSLNAALLGGVTGTIIIVGVGYWILMRLNTLKYRAGNTLYSLEMFNGKRLLSKHASISQDKTPQLTLQGWAVDDIAKQAAGGVLICIDEMDTLALYGKERADVVRNLQNTAYQFSGFSAVINIQQLAKGEHAIRLKIITADKKGYYLSDKAFTLLVL